MLRRGMFMALAGLGLACGSQQKVDDSGPAVLVEVDRILPEAESLDASKVEVTLAVTNASAEPLTLEAVNYRIDTGNVAGVLEGSAGSGATIEAQQTSEVQFTQSIPFPEETEAYKAVLERKTIPIDLTGEVSFSNGDSVSFKRVSEVATPEVPRLVMHDAQAARYGKEGVDVTIFLRLVNDNVFPVLVEGTEYTVSINGKEVKREQAGVGLRLGAGFAQEFEVSSVLDEKTMGDALPSILSDGRLTYTVTGSVQLKRMTVPFDYSGDIELATGE